MVLIFGSYEKYNSLFKEIVIRNYVRGYIIKIWLISGIKVLCFR